MFAYLFAIFVHSIVFLNFNSSRGLTVSAPPHKFKRNEVIVC
nr:MAG TPA: hypothetical protein [Inoviridae sp.]